jgi:hypothetical protein
MKHCHCLVFFLVYLSLVLKSESGQKIQHQESILEFAVCPKSHPYESRKGQICCTNRLSPEGGVSCGKAVYCGATRCEDYISRCRCEVCKNYNYLSYENMHPSYDGRYQEIKDILEANRPIFRKNSKCIWWHQLSRRWWIGSCKKVGRNAGFAHTEVDEQCPRTKKWRRGGSGLLIPNIEFSWSIDAAVGAVRPGYQSGTAGIDTIISHDIYRQQCRLKYRNGRYKCTRNR